ncbi:hypothetical protein D3C78_1397170 [compost metagenome]
MNRHPVNQVAQLANATAYPASCLAEGQFHAFNVAALQGRAADEAAEGEVFAGGDDDAVDGGDGEFEVDDFVVLQGEVGVAEFADEFRGVFEVAIWQTLGRGDGACVAFAGTVPGDLAEQSFLPHAQPVEGWVVEGEWFHP